MKMISSTVYKGRNIYSHKKCIKLEVDLEGYSEIASKDIESFNERLLELVPEKYLKKNKVYYLYCDLGIRSEQLSKMLNKKGYKTFSIEGGYKAYKKSNVN